MATDRSMQGRGWAILRNLLRILRNYERHGITSGEADHMTIMHRSINEMESVLLSRGDNLVLEPDVEEPSAEEMQKGAFVYGMEPYQTQINLVLQRAWQSG